MPGYHVSQTITYVHIRLALPEGRLWILDTFGPETDEVALYITTTARQDPFDMDVFVCAMPLVLAGTPA